MSLSLDSDRQRSHVDERGEPVSAILKQVALRTPSCRVRHAWPGLPASERRAAEGVRTDARAVAANATRPSMPWLWGP